MVGSNFVVFLGFALFSETVGTVVGFGSTTILIPLASFLLPIKETIVIVSLFHLFGTIWRTSFFRKEIDLRLVLFFGVPSLVFAGIGALLLGSIEASFLTRILGVFLIIFATTSLTGAKIHLPRTNLVSALAGSGVGFLAGLIGTAGALRGAFLASFDIEKKRYLGTAAAIGLGADIVRVLVYKQTELLKVTPGTVVILATVALLGTFMGRKIVLKVPQELFRKLVFWALILAGLRFLYV